METPHLSIPYLATPEETPSQPKKLPRIRKRARGEDPPAQRLRPKPTSEDLDMARLAVNASPATLGLPRARRKRLIRDAAFERARLRAEDEAAKRRAEREAVEVTFRLGEYGSLTVVGRQADGETP